MNHRQETLRRQLRTLGVAIQETANQLLQLNHQRQRMEQSLKEMTKQQDQILQELDNIE